MSTSNKNITLIPELLAPAGSPEKLRYALAYGADAVYAGIPRYSLRARENPFTNTSLKEAIQEVRRQNKKIYLTANILPLNRKLKSFQQSLAEYAEAGVDAFIMSDPGMIHFVLKELPQIPVHLSVQANAMNSATARFWFDLGVRRIILSRELSLSEIQEIHQEVPELELEAFVHGSICIAYSGRCLLSNYFNHRDANQGTCTNSCRWEYNLYQTDGSPATGDYSSDNSFYIEEQGRPGSLMPIEEDEHGTYIMNSKDLRAIEYLSDLRDAGTMSFKLEGRSKSIYYLGLATRAYRKAIDDLTEGKPFDPYLMTELSKTSNRGFTSAFLENRNNAETERFDSSQETNLPMIYAGAVKGEVSDGWMEVDVKNRIEVGDELEYVSPHRQYRFTLDAMENPRGLPVSLAHGGNGVVRIKTNEPIEPFALLSLAQKTKVIKPAS